MKKFFIWGSLALLTLTVFGKGAISNTSKQVPAMAANTIANPADDPTMLHYTVDVTGLTFHNDCTGEDMLIVSGVFFLNSHQDGTVASYNLHDFVLQAADGSIYRGIWAGTFTLTGSEAGPGTITNTYKAIMTTSGAGNNSLLKGVFHITTNSNGAYTVVIDSFTAGCQ